jgi:hypothetical protein
MAARRTIAPGVESERQVTRVSAADRWWNDRLRKSFSEIALGSQLRGARRNDTV